METSISSYSSETESSTGINIKFTENESPLGRRYVIQDVSSASSENMTLSDDGMISKTQPCQAKKHVLHIESEEKVTQIWAKQSKPRKIVGEQPKPRTENWARSTISTKKKHVPQAKKQRNKVAPLDQEGESYIESMESDKLSFRKHVAAIGIMAPDEIHKLHKFYLHMKKGQSRGKTVQASRPVTQCENHSRKVSNDKAKFPRRQRSANHEKTPRPKSTQKKNIENKQQDCNRNIIDQWSTSSFNLPSISQTQFEQKFIQPHPSQYTRKQTMVGTKSKFDRDNRKILTKEKPEPLVRIDYATLKVSNLPSSAKYADLEVLFPEAISMTLPTREIIDRENDEYDLYAYILLATVLEAKNAKNRVAGRRFRGHDLIIEYRQTY